MVRTLVVVLACLALVVGCSPEPPPTAAGPVGTPTLGDGSRVLDYSIWHEGGVYSNITVRDFFAAAAIHAADHRENLGNSNEAIAERAYKIADAMLAERSKQP